jgi:hypothetical protein
MKFLTAISLIAFVCGILFFGYIFVVQKTMSPTVIEKDPFENPMTTAQRQSQKTEEAWEQQRRMREDQIQRMRDLQRH